MVQPKFRSRSYRRVFKRTPTGKNVLTYVRRKTGKAQCKDCGRVLSGVASGISNLVKKMSKTQRRPERPYGGVLCNVCTKKEMINKAKAMVMKDG
jgi:large subunit ribosomal protein L34e